MNKESNRLIERIKVIISNYEENKIIRHIVSYSEAEQALCAIKQELESLCPHGDYYFHCNESGEQFDEPCTLAHMQDSEICCEQKEDDYHCPYCNSDNIEDYDLETLSHELWRCFDCNREFKNPKGENKQ